MLSYSIPVLSPRVLSVAFSPDGNTVASADRVQPINQWDVATGKKRATFGKKDDQWNCVAFSPDGKTLAAGGDSGDIKAWDVAHGKEHAIHSSSVVYSVAFSPDGRTLATGNSDTTITLWTVATLKVQATLTGHSESVSTVAFSPDGQMLASGSSDGTIRLWDVATGKTRVTLTPHADRVYSVTFSPDGKTLASGALGQIDLWNLAAAATLADNPTTPQSGRSAPPRVDPGVKLSTIPPGCTMVFAGTKVFFRDASGHRTPAPDGDYAVRGLTIRVRNGEQTIAPY
jgi:WD40 repeat protein